MKFKHRKTITVIQTYILIYIIVMVVTIAVLFHKIPGNSTVLENDGLNDNGCICERSEIFRAKIDRESVNQTFWCSLEALNRGYGQRVIAYSVYGNTSDSYVLGRYFSLLPMNVARIRRVYSGWTIRVYHNTSSSDTEALKRLCQIYCQDDQVDLCNVTAISQQPNLPQENNLVRNVFPLVWRFYPLLDNQVDLFMSRDMDSRITNRELDAVDQWLTSNYSFHVMRDHPFHKFIVLGGLWGVKLNRLRPLLLDLIVECIENAQEHKYGKDQDVLRDFVWPVAKYDVLAHDSYFCITPEILMASHLKIFPFPTQRNSSKDFVGDVEFEGDKYRSLIHPCPSRCRPKNHREWIYC